MPNAIEDNTINTIIAAIELTNEYAGVAEFDIIL